MAKIDPERYGVNTLAVRAGRQPTGEGEHSEPLFLTSSYVFKDAAQAAARFAEEEPGNIYSRFTNSTVRIFEERLAAMERAERCIRHVFRHGRHTEYLPGSVEGRRPYRFLAQRVRLDGEPVQQGAEQVRYRNQLCLAQRLRRLGGGDYRKHAPVVPRDPLQSP